jgi:uncharacterized protein YkwD
MNSPPHRKNTLRDTITEAGMGITIYAEAADCGAIYVTMAYGKPLG